MLGKVRLCLCLILLTLLATGGPASAQESDWDEAAFVEKLEAEYQAYRPLAQEATRQFELKLTAYEQAYPKEQWLEDAFAGNRAAQWLVFQAVWRDRYAFLDFRVHDRLLYRWASEIAEEEKYVRAAVYLQGSDMFCGNVRFVLVPLACPLVGGPEQTAKMNHWVKLAAMAGDSFWQLTVGTMTRAQIRSGRLQRDQWDKRLAEARFWLHKAKEAGREEDAIMTLEYLDELTSGE